LLIRYIKIVLALFLALLCLLYGGQNIANLDAAYGFVANVLGVSDSALYPATLGFAIGSPVLVWLTLAIIILGELGAGALTLKGT